MKTTSILAAVENGAIPTGNLNDPIRRRDDTTQVEDGAIARPHADAN